MCRSFAHWLISIMKWWPRDSLCSLWFSIGFCVCSSRSLAMSIESVRPLNHLILLCPLLLCLSLPDQGLPNSQSCMCMTSITPPMGYGISISHSMNTWTDLLWMVVDLIPQRTKVFSSSLQNHQLHRLNMS